MTGEARPSETEAAKRSELSVTVTPVEESKKEEKTLMLLSAWAELVVVSKEIKEISAKKGVEKKDEDETETNEEMHMSGNGEGVQKRKWLKLLQIGALGNEVEPGEKEDLKKM